MRAKDSPFSAHEAQLAYWEMFVEEHSAIPLQGQDDLRELLQTSVADDLRERVIRLLNPRKANVVELSQQDYDEGRYDVAARDNYGRSVGTWEQRAVFDAARGYYAVRVIRPLRRPTESE